MALFKKEKKKRIQNFISPFSVILEIRTLLSAAFLDRRGNGWKSASERPIWSAFYGLEGNANGAGNFLLPLGQSVVSGTFYLE